MEMESWVWHGPSTLEAELGRPVSYLGLSRKFKASQGYRGRRCCLKEVGVRENRKEDGSINDGYKNTGLITTERGCLVTVCSAAKRALTHSMVRATGTIRGDWDGG